MRASNGKTENIESSLQALNAEIVHRAQFPKPEKRLLDYIVKRENDITFVKLAKSIHTTSSLFKELKRLSSFLKINVLLISDKINYENTVEGVLHIKDRVGIIRPKTVHNIIKGEKVYIYEFKGMYYVKINGEKLRKLRLKKGYGLSELAKVVGTSVKALQKYEEGSMDMSVEKAYRFIELFDKEFEYVLKEVDIFRDRIIQSVQRKNPLNIRSDELRYRVLRQLIDESDEIELFNYFPSDMILNKKGARVFITLIDNRIDIDTAISKARENREVSRVLHGIPISIVDEDTTSDIVKELEEYGMVYRCSDITKHGIDLNSELL